jgi:hypothetical protein
MRRANVHLTCIPDPWSFSFIYQVLMLELGAIPHGSLTSMPYLLHSARSSSMHRVVVIGSICSGKSTFSRYLSGKLETFRQTFLSRESIIWWVLKTYHLKRRSYAVLLKEQKAKGVSVIELNPQKAVDAYLKRSLYAV